MKSSVILIAISLDKCLLHLEVKGAVFKLGILKFFFFLVLYLDVRQNRCTHTRCTHSTAHMWRSSNNRWSWIQPFTLDGAQVLRLNSKFLQTLSHLTAPQTMLLLTYSPKEIALEDHNISTTLIDIQALNLLQSLKLTISKRMRKFSPGPNPDKVEKAEIFPRGQPYAETCCDLVVLSLPSKLEQV